MFYRFPSKDFDNSILLAFKFRSQWNYHVILKVSHGFNPFVCFLNESGYTDSRLLLDAIKNFCSLAKINIVLIDPEFSPSIDESFISSLNKDFAVGIMIFDNYIYPESTKLCSAGSFVLSGDPLFVLECQSYGIPACYFPLEGEFLDVNPDIPLEGSPYDIIFYGSVTESRKPFLDSLTRISNIRVRVHDSSRTPVAYSELKLLIQSAKICINFSRHEVPALDGTTKMQGNYIGSTASIPFRYGHKGRIQEIGFARRLCISEVTPTLVINGLDQLVPQFTSSSEMCQLVAEYANKSDELLSEHILQFSKKVDEEFSSFRVGLRFADFCNKVIFKRL